MLGSSVAGRSHIDLVWVGPCVGNKVREGLGWNRGINLDNKRHATDARDRYDIPQEVEFEILMQRRIDRVRWTSQKQCVTVRRRVHDRLSANIAAGTWPVLDDKRLTEPFRQSLSNEARNDGLRATGRKADNDAHRPRGIDLRPCYSRCDRERDSVHSQVQELAPLNFHGPPPQTLGEALVL